MRYVAFCDAASGERRGNDAFTLAMAHAEHDRAVLDVLRAWVPPFNPSGVIAEIADVLKPFRVRAVTGDKYAPGIVAEHFRAHGIRYFSLNKEERKPAGYMMNKDEARLHQKKYAGANAATGKE
jgi:hypothetical protein